MRPKMAMVAMRRRIGLLLAAIVFFFSSLHHHLLPLLFFQSISASRSFSLKGQPRTCMAVSLLCNEISDLCIGKPPLRSLPATATVGEALVALKVCGETFVSVAAATTTKARAKAALPPGIAGRICMVDVLCFLCAEGNISAPAAALKSPVSALLAKGEGSVRKVETNSSILEAVDVLLESSARALVVPIRPSFPKKKRVTNQEFCWLTQEDLVRFFLNNIFLFSSIAPLSVAELGLVSPAVLSVRHHVSATSALPLIRSALHDSTSVAVVTDDGKLIGEISPLVLSTCDETVAAAIASLSAGDLMAYIDCCICGGAPESVVQEVKARLKDKELGGMLEFLEDEELLSTLSLSSSSASSSSSSDEEAEMAAKKRRPRRMRSGSYSARMGRRSEEAIVCHPESSLVAVMVQALAYRVSYLWVVDEKDYELVGIVTFQDVLRVFREQLQ